MWGRGGHCGPMNINLQLKGGMAMKEFLEPRLEVLQFYAEEILTASGDLDGGGIETPDRPLS